MELEVDIWYKWSWRWTFGNLFVPVLNSVRPWPGFAEIQKSWKYASDCMNKNISLDAHLFSLRTVFLATSFLIYNRFELVLQYDFALANIIGTNELRYIVDGIDTVVLLSAMVSITHFLSYLTAVLYLHSISNGMRIYEDCDIGMAGARASPPMKVPGYVEPGKHAVDPAYRKAMVKTLQKRHPDMSIA
jgi:hypothetical protein